MFIAVSLSKETPWFVCGKVIRHLKNSRLLLLGMAQPSAVPHRGNVALIQGLCGGQVLVHLISEERVDVAATQRLCFNDSGVGYLVDVETRVSTWLKAWD